MFFLRLESALFNDIREVLLENENIENVSFKKLFTEKPYNKALLIGLIVSFFHMASISAIVNIFYLDYAKTVYFGDFRMSVTLQL